MRVIFCDALDCFVSLSSLVYEDVHLLVLTEFEDQLVHSGLVLVSHLLENLVVAGVVFACVLVTELVA